MNPDLFPPSKRRGLIVHAVIVLILAAISAWGFINMTRVNVGPLFFTLLLVGVIAFLPIPYLAYRAYALLRANYELGREHLIIRWGLRAEEIPLSDIEWVRAADDLTRPLVLPWFRMPGAILGLRRHPDLGLVEFIASERKNLLLVATARRVFVISPEQANTFVNNFARLAEMGSLSRIEAKSVYPSFVFAQAWESPIVRFFWLSALFLNLGLFAWVSYLIPLLPGVSLGTQVGSGVVPPVPSNQLIILPLSSIFLAVIGWIAGLSFYRWEKQRPLAYLVWASGALTTFAFLIAVLFIISTPV